MARCDNWWQSLERSAVAKVTGLSGNEIYCLNLKGLRPGELVLGNSVYSTGLLGAVVSHRRRRAS